MMDAQTIIALCGVFSVVLGIIELMFIARKK